MPGMILDGIFAAETIDSSGEVFEVEGADISSLTTDGFVNYEHKDDTPKDKIGRIVYAKKILKEEDCENERQRMYWKFVKVPFVYGKARLFDAGGHEGAKAAAASIRDMVANGEKPVFRWSIEGSTLQKKDNRLVRTMCRGVALTWKPCNKAAISGVLSDPENKSTKKDSDDALAALTTKHEIPGRQVLGGSVEVDVSPIIDPTVEDVADEALEKTMTGSVGDVAPSALTGGAALVREEIIGADKKKFRNQAKAAARDYDPHEHGPFKKFLKMRLPEASDEFIEHFSNAIDDFRMKKAEDGADIGLTPPKIDWEPPKNKNPLEAQPKTKIGTKITEGGRFETNSMRTGKVSLPGDRKFLHFHAPNEGKNADLYYNLLHADDPAKTPDLDPEEREKILNTVHRPFTRAAHNWLEINKLAREGKLPPGAIHLAGIFAAMSPNTSTAVQELYFGHYMDFTKEKGMDFTSPIPDNLQTEFHKLLNGERLPEFMNDYYVHNQPSEADYYDEDTGESQNKNPGASLADRPQGRPLIKFHELYPFLVGLSQKFRDDGRAMAGFLMHGKHVNKEADRRIAQGKEPIQDPTGLPRVEGFGPKLARYATAMFGGGNMLVNDRHMMRALFDIPLDAKEAVQHVVSSLSRPQAERLLEALDNHFYQRHPAVKKVLDMYPDKFKNPEQATFLGFWLAWLLHPHYEKARGMPSLAQHGGTDHGPYFQAVKDLLDKSKIPHDMADYGQPWNEGSTDFDFGANTQKSEDPWIASTATLPTRIAHAMKHIEARFGQNPAMFFYYMHGVPALLASERAQSNSKKFVRKMQYFALELKRLTKAYPEVQPTGEKTQENNQPPLTPGGDIKPIFFNGETVLPGHARLREGFAPKSANQQVKDWHVLKQDSNYLYVHPALGEGQVINHADVRKWPAHNQGHAFDVIRGPQPATPNKNALVDMNVHGIPEYLMSKEQFDLAHGIDFEEEDPKGNVPDHFKKGIVSGTWRKVGPNKDKIGYVKPNALGGPTGMRSMSEAEGLYHNLAKHFFGLGKYVPTVTVFRHPKSGGMYSVIEGIPGAAHLKGGNLTQEDTLLRTRDEHGDLDKMLLMNSILTNSDRHDFNYMFGNNNSTFHLIDHGYTLHGRHGLYDLPGYYDRYHEATGSHGYQPMHPEAVEWLRSLDADKMGEMMSKHRAPPSVVSVAVDRLKAMQDYLAHNPEADAREIYGYADEANGSTNYTYRNARKARLRNSPEGRAELARQEAEQKKAQNKYRQPGRIAQAAQNLVDGLSAFDGATHRIKSLAEVFGVDPSGKQPEEIKAELLEAMKGRLTQKVDDIQASRQRNKDEWNRRLVDDMVEVAANREVHNRKEDKKMFPGTKQTLIGTTLQGDRLEEVGMFLGVPPEEGEDDAAYRARIQDAVLSQIMDKADAKERKAKEAHDWELEQNRLNVERVNADEKQEARERRDSLEAQVKRQKPEIQEIINAKEGMKPGAPMINKGRRRKKITLPGQRSLIPGMGKEKK